MSNFCRNLRQAQKCSSSCELESWLAISIIATWRHCPIAHRSPVGGSAALLGGLEDNFLLAVVVVRLIGDQAVRVAGELETRLGGVEA